MVAFVTARAVWISRIYGYMVLGLILCLSTAWIPQGGLFDFRADLMAYCLYGIWACAILRSKLFLDRRRAIGCSLIGAFLVANRFLTIVYLLGVSVGFARGLRFRRTSLAYRWRSGRPDVATFLQYLPFSLRISRHHRANADS